MSLNVPRTPTQKTLLLLKREAWGQGSPLSLTAAFALQLSTTAGRWTLSSGSQAWASALLPLALQSQPESYRGYVSEEGSKEWSPV